MKSISINSTAKINLTFDILGKLDDGYHKIETLLHEISISDEVILEEIKEDKIIVECSIMELSGEKNIAYKTAKLLKDKLGIKKGVRIKIKKNIPVGAGLGGGSSNAANILKGLNELWNLNLTNLMLMSFAQELGTDVPFFIVGGTAFGYNHGEMLERVNLNEKFKLILIKPEISVETKSAYSLADAHAIKLEKSNSTQKALKAIAEKKPIINLLHNDFEEVIFSKYPDIKEIKNTLLDNGASASLMTGSGSCVYGIFPDDKIRMKAYEKLKSRYPVVLLAD